MVLSVVADLLNRFQKLDWIMRVTYDFPITPLFELCHHPWCTLTKDDPECFFHTRLIMSFQRRVVLELLRELHLLESCQYPWDKLTLLSDRKWFFWLKLREIQFFHLADGICDLRPDCRYFHFDEVYDSSVVRENLSLDFWSMYG
jgi:hypothetical protein